MSEVVEVEPIEVTFNERLSHLLTFDKIRIGKIIEMAQYSIIGVIVTILLTYLLAKVNMTLFHKSEDEESDISTIELIGSVCLKVVMSVLLVFYIKKIILLVPSISASLIDGFKPDTTIEYTLHVSSFFVILELMYEIKSDLELLYDRFYEHDH